MKRVLVAALIALGSVSSVAAQDISDLSASLKAMQLQIDRLQALVATQTNLPNQGLYVWADPPSVTAPGQAVLYGWGFGCVGTTPGTVEIMVDGVVVTTAVLLTRYDRADVQAWAVASGACPTAPLTTGIEARVDLSSYTPGLHVLKFRIRNTAGVMAVSNPREIGIFGTR